MIEAMQRWCDEADELALHHFGGVIATERKADGTPVTVADRAIEQALRDAIARDEPGAAIVGEEQGGSLPERGVAWILDPIDGTKNYARGVPVFATLAARWSDGVLTDAIVSAPALRTRWWATGGAAFRNGAAIEVSGIEAVADADICTGGLQSQWLRGADRPRLHAVLDAARRHRGFGDFWGYMLVAQGSMEAMVEFAPLKLWDVAAPRCILETAGGRWTGHTGEATLGEGAAIGSNGLVHDDLVTLLSA